MKPGGHAGDGQVCSELPSPIYVSTCVSAASLMGQVLVELTGRSLRVYSRSRCEVVANFPVFDLLGLSACLPRLAIALSGYPCGGHTVAKVRTAERVRSVTPHWLVGLSVVRDHMAKLTRRVPVRW